MKTGAASGTADASPPPTSQGVLAEAAVASVTLVANVASPGVQSTGAVYPKATSCWPKNPALVVPLRTMLSLSAVVVAVVDEDAVAGFIERKA